MTTTLTLVFPLWLICLPLAVIPAIRVKSALRRRNFRRRKKCITCGYDLRASAGLCPECGRETAGKLQSPRSMTAVAAALAMVCVISLIVVATIYFFVERRRSHWWPYESSRVLEAAVAANDAPAVKNALKRGTSQDARNGALLVAAWNRDVEIVRLLLDHDADANVQDAEHHKPLHLILPREGDAEEQVAALLLARHADVNARDEAGYAPLHLAIRNRDVPLARALINGGADVRMRDKENRLPIDSFDNYRFPELAELIQSHGGIHESDSKATP